MKYRTDAWSLNDAKTLANVLHTALRGEVHALGDLEKLSVFTQRSREISLASLAPQDRLATFAQDCLGKFKIDHKPEAELLQARFIDKTSIKSLALKLFLSQEQVSRRQRQAFETLANWLYAEECRAAQNAEVELSRVLPPSSYTRLFGITELGPKLLGLLADDDHWVISLVGLGGLGKTALADWAVRRTVIDRKYSKLVWLRNEDREPLIADQLIRELCERLLPQVVDHKTQYVELRKYLKSNPTLTVLDNLDEFRTGPNEFDLLHDLANPSKFLLTTRNLPGVLPKNYVVPLHELDSPSATEFFEYEIKSRGYSVRESVNENYFEPIYASAGGNPLALRLVAGLMHVWSLPSISDALREKSAGDVAEMYNQLYALNWTTLGKSSHLVMEAFQFVSSDGGTTDHLQAISGLEKSELRAALAELRTRSLLDMRGNPLEPRYGIHHLTQTFVNSTLPTGEHSRIENLNAANLAYWQQHIQDPYDALRADRHNLEKAVSSGLSLKKTVPAAIELLSLLFPGILGFGWAEEWLPYFKLAMEKELPRGKEMPSLGYQAAALLWQAGNLEGAEESFNVCMSTARKLNNGRGELAATLGLVLCKWSAKKYDAAWSEYQQGQKLLNELSRNDPLRFRALAIQGMLLFAKHKYKLAIKCFESSLDEELPPAIEAQLRMNLGLALQADRKLRKSMFEYEKAASLLKEVPENIKLLAKVELLRYVLYRKQKKLDAAEAAVKRAANLLNRDVDDVNFEIFLEPGLVKTDQTKNTNSEGVSQYWRQMGGSWLLTDDGDPSLLRS